MVIELDWHDAYLKLDPKVKIKLLEHPYLYHIERDELYEIDQKAMAFLLMCDGSKKGSELTSDDEFVRCCLKEGVLEALKNPNPVSITSQNAPTPSLRYLELQLLNACNLKCRHCYQGDKRHQDVMPLEDAIRIAVEFSALAGLRLMISGGEPLLYPYLEEFIDATSGLKLRRVLITNGTLITEQNISFMDVEDIQFSLDGWGKGHDLLRGKGQFEKTLKGIMIAKDAGIQISIATMIHRENLDDFDRLKDFIEEIGATRWGIDVPCVSGSLLDNRDLLVSYEDATPFMRYSFGGGYHGPSEGFACGRHLMTILPTGMAAKCGFYEENPLGDAKKGILGCWQNLYHIPLEKLECRGCAFLDECAGGCRFRASAPLAPDPVMCAFYKCNAL